jgi:hypothetical protein
MFGGTSSSGTPSPVRESTKQPNKHVATNIEAALKAQLAKGEVGTEEKKPVPTFQEFAPGFLSQITADCRRNRRQFPSITASSRLSFGIARWRRAASTESMRRRSTYSNKHASCNFSTQKTALGCFKKQGTRHASSIAASRAEVENHFRANSQNARR